MKQNMGLTDRIIRMIIAITLGSIYYMNFVSGTAAVIVVILAAISLITSLIGYCPIYHILGIGTAGEKKE